MAQGTSHRGFERLGSPAGDSAYCTLGATPHGLDRIEVRRIGWEIHDSRADGLDRFSDAEILVRSQVIEDQHIIRTQPRRERLANKVDEALGVD